MIIGGGIAMASLLFDAKILQFCVVLLLINFVGESDIF